VLIQSEDLTHFCTCDKSLTDIILTELEIKLSQTFMTGEEIEIFTKPISWSFCFFPPNFTSAKLHGDRGEN